MTLDIINNVVIIDLVLKCHHIYIYAIIEVHGFSPQVIGVGVQLKEVARAKNPPL